MFFDNNCHTTILEHKDVAILETTHYLIEIQPAPSPPPKKNRYHLRYINTASERFQYLTAKN